MMTRKLRTLFTVFFTLVSGAFFIFASTNEPQEEHNPFGPPKDAPYYIPKVKASDARRAPSALPSRVHNGLASYFPPIFNQAGNSCGPASQIGYMFTAEMNAYRNADGKLQENMYPSHFTYLLQGVSNAVVGPDKAVVARDVGMPNVADYGGRTYSRLFGYQDESHPYGWMTGYDKWYRAMFNRIKGGVEKIGALNKPENATMLKGWLYNHNGDPDFGGRGGIVFVGLAISNSILKEVTEGPYKGEKFVLFGTDFDHSMCIVGYDDEIWCDINSDGVKTDNEIGAWIFSNTWGEGWANKGFVYCPYSLAKATSASINFFEPGLYRVRTNYKPKQTLKISMDFSHRGDISLSAGVSSDLNASVPEKTITMTHFNYSGKRVENKVVYSDIPMLGKWADGVMHTEPMEFGYDITDLLEGVDLSKPFKLFLTIKTSGGSPGVGTLQSCSMMDYTIYKDGVEIPFEQKKVNIENDGKITVVSQIIKGNQINPPVNLSWSGNALQWMKPHASSYSYALNKYRIYKNGIFVRETGADVLQSVLDNAVSGELYTVSAVYEINGETLESKQSVGLLKKEIKGQLITETGSYDFAGGSFSLGNIFSESKPQTTIEFWTKLPAGRTVPFKFGTETSKLIIQIDTNGRIWIGYDGTSAFILYVASPVVADVWTHIALTIDGKKVTLYKDGQLLTSKESKNPNGIPPTANYMVTGMHKLDELRVWNKVLSAEELKTNKERLVLYPEGQKPQLEAYYQMDVVNGKLNDAVGNRDLTLGAGSADAQDYPLKAQENSFTLDAETAVVNQRINILESVIPPNTLKTSWYAPEAGLNSWEGEKPEFIFTKAGTFEISKTVTLSDQSTLTSKKRVNITAESLPKPDFTFSSSAIRPMESVSMANISAEEGVSYEWILQGAETEKLNSVDASATYNSSGTFPVTLKATNSAGTTSITKNITVLLLAPKVDFVTENDITEIIQGGTLKFLDRSIYDPTEWSWSFGGGVPAGSNERNPVVSYPNTGVFPVMLTIKNQAGISEVVRKEFVTVSSGNAGSALKFDGDNDMLKVPVLMQDAGATTIEWWSSCPPATQSTLFSTAGFSIQYSAYGRMSIGFGMYERMNIGLATMPENTWNHFAFTFNNGVAKLYRNGVEVSSQVFNKTMADFKWSEGLTLGTDKNSSTATFDEIRVWNVERTQSEIIAGMNSKLENPASLSSLELYLTFDEEANANPKDYSSKARQTQRLNIGPPGDMWVKSYAFCARSLEKTAVEPDLNSSYIIYRKSDFKRFNASANTFSSQFRSEFVQDGFVTIPCKVLNAPYGLDGKKVRVGSSEYNLLGAPGKYYFQEKNTGFYVRKDGGYLHESATYSTLPFVKFEKNVLNESNIVYSNGYMIADNYTWNLGGKIFNFDFIIEEVKKINKAVSYADVSGEMLQQLRFDENGELTGTPKMLAGSVSYAQKMQSNRWYALSFANDVELISFVGKTVSNDTVRLGGALAYGSDFSLKKYENGEFKPVPLITGATLPAGAYFFRLTNDLLDDKEIVFTSKRRAVFAEVYQTPEENTLVGTGMSTITAVNGLSGYYVLDAAGSAMNFVSGAPVAIRPFQAYIPYAGNASEAKPKIEIGGVLSGLKDLNPGNDENIRAYAVDNFIRVSGIDAEYRVYGLNGMELDVRKKLERGVYIVKIDGVRSAYKVIVQ